MRSATETGGQPLPARLELSGRAERDLRRLQHEDAQRVHDALANLREGAQNVDVKALQGSAPWLRLRAGELRVLYRPLTAQEATDRGPGWLIARVIHRRELERAVASLSH
jgi:mRNA-degrading endonuclease RelE of RelBE toxin-antitoxin system